MKAKKTAVKAEPAATPAVAVPPPVTAEAEADKPDDNGLRQSSVFLLKQKMTQLITSLRRYRALEKSGHVRSSSLRRLPRRSARLETALPAVL